tara:strand:+ start:17954 stop:18190 length:237 start_codon:yes stop_codon:yes gene_type:complete
MSIPDFYLVADGNAYALDENNVAFGAPVFDDNTVDWENSYDFSEDLAEDELEYIAHMCQLLVQAQELTTEFHHEVFVK